MNPASEDLKDFIELSSTGLDFTFGTNMFIGDMPDKPDNCITLYDTGGPAPQANYDYYKPTVQILIRGDIQGYQNAWDQANSLSNALHGVAGETVNSTYYSQILASSDLMFVGKDDSNRPIFSINFEIHRY